MTLEVRSEKGDIIQLHKLERGINKDNYVFEYERVSPRKEMRVTFERDSRKLSAKRLFLQKSSGKWLEQITRQDYDCNFNKCFQEQAGQGSTKLI